MLVVGEHDLVKVHIHSLHPGMILEECLKWGTLHDIKIDNLEEEAEAQVQLQNGIADEAVVFDNNDKAMNEHTEDGHQLAEVESQDAAAVTETEDVKSITDGSYEVQKVSMMSEPVSLSDYKESKKIGWLQSARVKDGQRSYTASE
jgi:dihydroxyacetone kinase-like predicted kinase